jgi:hypothetical protein
MEVPTERKAPLMFKSFTVTIIALFVFFLSKDIVEGATSPFIVIPVGTVAIAALMVAFIGAAMVALRINDN